LIARAADQLQELNETELRSITRDLHPSVIRLGLGPALCYLAEAFAPSFEIKLDLGLAERAPEGLYGTALPEEVRLAIYRVVEECLINVRKHGEARSVVVSLGAPDGDTVRVSVRDDGRGFDTSRTRPGHGMLFMQDYCGAHEGTLKIISQPGKGTCVEATLRLT
jgi:signal transduction histidine kinase